MRMESDEEMMDMTFAQLRHTEAWGAAEEYARELALFSGVGKLTTDNSIEDLHN